MWRNGNRIHFQTTVTENNSNVITGAYIDLKEIKPPSIKSNLCSSVTLKSNAVFDQMADYVKSHPDEIKKINGVFHYIVTLNGKPQADWSKYLGFYKI
jgi:3-hydroxyacyl-CoA dehydrogenase/3a,7a,12a-trihydroxy-5b-cholest-24-enoyl-CoA hydratase